MWYNKNKICQEPGKLNQPLLGRGLLDTAASTGAYLLIEHGIPRLGKKKLLKWVDTILLKL